MKNDDVKYRLETLKAAINRYYDDGCLKWDVPSVQGVLIGSSKGEINAFDSIIVNKLKQWEKLGVVKFIGTDECYFQVLRKFTMEEKEDEA